MEQPTAETKSGLRKLPIHEALIRPILLAGADRELTLANGVICVALVFGIGISKYTIGVVALLLTAGQWALGRAGRYDVQLRSVYLRHVRLGDLYLAASGLHTGTAAVHPAVPFSG